MKKFDWRSKRRLILIITASILLLTLGVSSYFYQKDKSSMAYPLFIEALEKNQIQTVVLSNGSTFKAYLTSDPKTTYTVPNPKIDTFVETLLINGVEVKYSDQSIETKALQGFFLVALGGFILFLVKRDSKNGFQIQNAKKKTKETPCMNLSDVAGNTEAKQMVSDIISFIKEPEKYSTVGARMPKGLLLYGPPGTGKTLMAKAIAGEANVPFYAMSGSDFVQMYVGVGASRIRKLFQKAKQSERAVIFIDEIDAIGKKRARTVSASNDERDQTLNALLTEMSGFHESQGIVVIGATNRLDTLDEALLRPGRFDRQIEIGLPDINAREKILSLYCSKKPLGEDVDIKHLAKSTVYFSGAMLENLINEAAIYAANDSQTVIKKEHMDKAFYTIIAGAPKADNSYLTTQDREITAYHEAGHALLTTLLLPEHFLSKVTIIPSVKGAGGFNLSIPRDVMYQTNQGLLSHIKMLLAGRAAEELIFGENQITTGASNDIEKASTLLLHYMDKYGMDKELGMFTTSILSETYDTSIIQKCREKMNILYQETKNLLTENIDSLKGISLELLEKETLDGDDIKRICQVTNSH